MNELEWRLARTFIRAYSLLLLLRSVQALPFILRVLLSPPSGIPISLFDISAPAMLLVLAVPLWLYSGSIADRVAGSGNAAVEDERLEFPFELGVGLIGLVFLVQGASGLAGEAVESFLSGSGSVFGTIRPSGVVEARDVAVFSTEAALGLVLFVGQMPSWEVFDSSAAGEGGLPTTQKTDDCQAAKEPPHLQRR